MSAISGSGDRAAPSVQGEPWASGAVRVGGLKVAVVDTDEGALINPLAAQLIAGRRPV